MQVPLVHILKVFREIQLIIRKWDKINSLGTCTLATSTHPPPDIYGTFIPNQSAPRIKSWSVSLSALCATHQVRSPMTKQRTLLINPQEATWPINSGSFKYNGPLHQLPRHPPTQPNLPQRSFQLAIKIMSWNAIEWGPFTL